MAKRMQVDRRKDTIPWTWEPFVGILLAYVFVVLATAQVARSLAYLLSGDGWRWPTQDTEVTSAVALFGGHPAAGLPGHHVPGISRSLLLTTLITLELLALVTLTAGLIEAYRRWGSARMYGMATRADAQQLLGAARLRRQARVIRPDLYGHRTSRRPHALVNVDEEPDPRAASALSPIRSRLRDVLSRVTATRSKE